MARHRVFPVQRILLLLAILPSLLFALPGLLAQPSVRFAGSTSVGFAGPTQTVSVTVLRGGTLDSLRVRTEGSDGFDFALASGGTCLPGITYAVGQQCLAAISFIPTTPGQRSGAVVLLDRSGAPLGTTFLSASATGGLHVFVPGTIETVAGESVWLYGGDGAPATSEAIFLPFGVAVDASGAIFIADSSNNRIRRVDPVTTLMSTVAGNGLIGSSGDGGPATNASLSSPTAVAVDPAGNIFFTDSGNNIVRRIDAFTGILTTFAGTPGRHGFSGDGAPAIGATLNAPNGIAFDAAGNLYLADTGNHAIRRVDAVTGLISTVAGVPGVAGMTGDGGPATAAYLNGPWGLTVASSGEIYIADQNNQRVRRIDTAGVMSTVAGTGVAGYNNDGISATTAMLNAPGGVAVDAAGNVYIADSGNNRVRKINHTTGVISSIAGNIGQAFSGDGGPANAAGLYGPYTLALDGSGNLLIADVFHNRIRRIAANSATLQYPPMRVGRTSPPEQQLVENDGNASMTISAVNPRSSSALDPAGTTCFSTPLLPLDQCTVSVSFAPTSTGTLVVGTALVQSDASNSPGTLNLTGQVLSVDPSTVTLVSVTNPIQTGSVATFNVGATSAGLTPTGPVTLLDGSTVLATVTLDKNGYAFFSIPGLKGGQHPITASYAGDSSNTAATSPVVIQIVKDPVADTATSLSASANPVTAGASLRLTAQVTTQVNGAGNGDIGGTMTFKDGSAVLGTGTVTAGSAVFNTTLSTGQHSISASYAGSGAYNASTSPALSETVSIASSKTVLLTSANPAAAGSLLTLSATVSGTGGIPGGSVTFADGSINLGFAVLNAAGTATLSVPGSTWPVGTHQLTAAYAGDTNDQPSTSTSYPEVVNLAQTATVLGSSANPVGLGGAVTFTATVTGSGGTPGGSVQFLDGSSLLGTATLNQYGAATLTSSALPLGTQILTAQYGGDAYDAASNSSPLTEQIQAATVSVTLTTSSNPALLGDPLTLSATVSGTGSQPTGSVQFLDGSTSVGSAKVNPNGSASLAVSTLTLGNHTLVASYSGDKNHSAVISAPLNEHLVQPTTTGFTASTLRSIAGNSIQWTVTVTGRTAQTPTGSVSITDNAVALTTMPLDSTGKAIYATSALSPGQHTLIATYPGDANDASSTSAVLINVIDQATSTTSLSSSANPGSSGDLLLLTATVVSNGGPPMGKLILLDGTNVLTTLALPSNGIANFQTSTLTPGIHALTAVFAGDTNTSGSTSPILSQRIAQRIAVTLTSSANPSLLSDPITLTAHAGNGTSSAPGGTVTLTDGGVSIATATLDPTGTAVFPVTAPTLGRHAYVASYSGDPQNLAGTSQVLTEEVDLRPTSTTFTSSAGSLSAGQTVVFVGVVQGSGTRAPTGTVTFNSGSTVLGTGTIGSTGVVTLTLTPPQGSFNVVATYSGDSLFAPSSSPALSVVVGPTREFLLTTDPTNMTLKSGDHGTMQLTLTSAPTYADTLALGCAGLPSMSTCTFSDNQIKLAGGLPKTLTVTFDTGAPLGSGATASTRTASTGTMLCGLPAGALLTLLLLRKRFRRQLGPFCTLLVLGTLVALTGCGTSFVQQATPPGSYSFQIVASGKQTGVTGTTTVQLTVTP